MILEYKSAKVFYSVRGNGKPVVLIHGFLENSSMWDNLVEDLSANNQVICVDLLGHGQSDCLGYVHTMRNFSEAIQAVLNHLNITNFKVVGHSLGGYVALDLAEMNPSKTEGLCLMNSTTKPDNNERISLRNRAIKTAKTHYESLVSMSISNLFYLDNRTTFSKEIGQLKTDALKTPVQGYIGAQEGMKLREDKTEFFNQARFKKMVIAGEKDPVIDFNTIKENATKSASEFVALKGGHMSQIEDLQDLKQALLQFIN